MHELAAEVLRLPADDFWFFVALCAAACLFGAGMGFVMLKRAREIEDIPTSKIRSAAQGHVEIEGIAQMLPGEPVQAPLSRKPCVWWKYAIEEKRGSGKNSRWVTLESDTSDEMFQLIDETGDCVVDPEGAKVIPNARLRWYGSSRWPRDVPSRTRWFGLGGYRYTEQRLELGSDLYALGWFRTEGGLAHSFDENLAVRELLAEWKADQDKLLREFDADGDGHIDMQEWTAVREAALQKVREQHLKLAVDPDIHVLCRPPRRQTFLLSSLPQHTLVLRARRRVAAGLALFLAGGSSTIWLLSVRGLL